MKTQNWLLLGIGAFALYKIVKAGRSNKETSNAEEFKNAVSPTTGAKQKINFTKCGCVARAKVIEQTPDYTVERVYYGNLYTSNRPFSGATAYNTVPTALNPNSPVIYKKCVENSDCGYKDSTRPNLAP